MGRRESGPVGIMAPTRVGGIGWVESFVTSLNGACRRGRGCPEINRSGSGCGGRDSRLRVRVSAASSRLSLSTQGHGAKVCQTIQL